MRETTHGRYTWTRRVRYCIAAWCSGWARFPLWPWSTGCTGVARAESGGIKLTVLYAKPKDPDAFNTYYLTKHMPLVMKIPGLQRTEVATVLPAPAGPTRAAILADYGALLPERRGSAEGAGIRGGQSSHRGSRQFRRERLSHGFCIDDSGVVDFLVVKAVRAAASHGRLTCPFPGRTPWRKAPGLPPNPPWRGASTSRERPKVSRQISSMKEKAFTRGSKFSIARLNSIIGCATTHIR